ncbi:MAG TPA: alpha-isopropylmalate synthase regulatory domain-containing protein, partial [Spirochaetota bacterium]
KLKARGNGPISALVHAIREIKDIRAFTLEDYAEDSMGSSAEADAICFVKLANDSGKIQIGVGCDPNVTQAAAKAVINGLNAMVK